jgi:predicted ABC-type ATPase
MSKPQPRILIIAGPNGAGKTTFAREFLPNEAGCPIFINADLIAAGLAPFSPESAAIPAARLMLRELARHFAARSSFAFETTLSGRTYLRFIDAWQTAGYRVKLIFLRLDTPEEAIARVAQRVGKFARTGLFQRQNLSVRRSGEPVPATSGERLEWRLIPARRGPGRQRSGRH